MEQWLWLSSYNHILNVILYNTYDLDFLGQLVPYVSFSSNLTELGNLVTEALKPEYSTDYRTALISWLRILSAGADSAGKTRIEGYIAVLSN